MARLYYKGPYFRTARKLSLKRVNVPPGCSQLFFSHYSSITLGDKGDDFSHTYYKGELADDFFGGKMTVTK